MRRLFSISKNIIIIALLVAIFNQLWYPLTYQHFEESLLQAAISESEDSIISLTPISVAGTSVEQFGSLQLTNDNPITAESTVVTSDTRIIAMRQFLIDYHSPLYPYADVFVTEADKYGLDWRLVASISGVESAFGNLIPFRSNNAWGWKGDPTRAWSHFTSWPQGIATITEGLARGYGTELTPFDIEPTYCPPCGRNPAHAWANGVTNFMNELERYEKSL